MIRSAGVPRHARPLHRGACLRAIGFLLIAGLSGCGGDAPQSATAPPPPPQAPPAPPSPPRAAAPAQSGPAHSPRSPASVPRRSAAYEDDALNLYTVGEALPNFTAEPARLRVREEVYTAVPPIPGQDSRNFSVALPSRAARPAQRQLPFELPEGFSIVESAGFDEEGYPRRLRCEADGAIMAYVPGGGFIQGRDDRAAEARPAHVAYVDGFYMDVQEVTLQQYQKYRTANLATRRVGQPVNVSDPSTHPALGILWRDAQGYAQWAGKSLPREAEWEKAGRGEHGFDFPWGDGRALWGQPRQPGQVHPVGSYPNDRSVYGVLDMAGNAREWCQDWYAPDTYAQVRTVDGSPPRNPEGASRSSPPNARVVKGAGTAGWHLWARAGVGMSETPPDVGFRCVLRLRVSKEEAATGPPPRGARSND